MSQSATTSIIALNMKRGGGVRTKHYSTNTNSWDGRGVQTIHYSTNTNSWDGRGVQTIHYSTINQFLGWEGGPDHTLQLNYSTITNPWDGRGVQTINYSTTVEPPRKGHFGTNINSSDLSPL